MLENNHFKELHKDLVDEIINLVPTKTGSASAKKGKHDDLVMSLALALECRESIPNFADYQTKSKLIDDWKKKVRSNRILKQKIPFRPASWR